MNFKPPLLHPYKFLLQISINSVDHQSALCVDKVMSGSSMHFLCARRLRAVSGQHKLSFGKCQAALIVLIMLPSLHSSAN